jgi:hypothetical protein
LDEGSATLIGPVEAGIRSICLCQQIPQPLSDSSPRRPNSENRDSLALGASDLDESAWNCGQLLATTQYTADLPVLSRYSQVVLCIWRL